MLCGSEESISHRSKCPAGRISALQCGGSEVIYDLAVQGYFDGPLSIASCRPLSLSVVGKTLGTRPNPGFPVGASSAPREPGKANLDVGIKY